MKRRTSEKADSELSAAELRARIERICGLPCPPDDSREAWAEHEVVSNFLLEARMCSDIDRAKRAAVEYTLQNNVYPLEMLRPHLERGLGRKLLDEEISAGILVD